MSKFRNIAKEVDLHDFRKRSCTICNNKVKVDSYNGKTGGSCGPSSGKILTCDVCTVQYFYDWNYQKKRYIIDRAYFTFGDCVDVLIDYGGKWLDWYKEQNIVNGKEKDNKNNVLFRVRNSQGFYEESVLALKTYSMPKKKLFKIIKDKAEVYEIFQ